MDAYILMLVLLSTIAESPQFFIHHVELWSAPVKDDSDRGVSFTSREGKSTHRLD